MPDRKNSQFNVCSSGSNLESALEVSFLILFLTNWAVLDFLMANKFNPYDLKKTRDLRRSKCAHLGCQELPVCKIGRPKDRVPNINEYLPIEMIREIFSYLPIRDNLLCRSVCKLWCSVSRSLNYAKLAIIRQNRRTTETSSFGYSCEPVKSLSLMELANDDCISKLLKEETFRNVREMTTFFSKVHHIYFENFYNHFIKLETLTIGSNDTCREAPWKTVNRVVLDLKCLKKLVVTSCFFHFPLNTPELLHLECVFFHTHFKFAYEDKIKFLRSSWISFDYLMSPQNILQELEILVVQEIFQDELIPFFEGLLHLKEVHLRSPKITSFPGQIGKLDEFRKESNRHFEIFVQGLGLEFYKEAIIRTNEHEPKMKEWLEEHTDFLVRNQHMMPKKVFLDFGINYDHLEALSVAERNVFLRKFEYVRSVSVNRQVENEKRLLELLEKTHPEHLSLKNFELYSKSFFDQLLLNCQFLRELSLEASRSLDSFEKFEFLFKLNNLTRLQVTNHLSPSFIRIIWKNIHSLKDLEVDTSSLGLRIVISWRANAFRRLHKEIADQPQKFFHYFANKIECIKFVSELVDSEQNL